MKPENAFITLEIYHTTMENKYSKGSENITKSYLTLKVTSQQKVKNEKEGTKLTNNVFEYILK